MVVEGLRFLMVIGVGRRLCSGWKADEGEKIKGAALVAAPVFLV